MRSAPVITLALALLAGACSGTERPMGTLPSPSPMSSPTPMTNPGPMASATPMTHPGPMTEPTPMTNPPPPEKSAAPSPLLCNRLSDCLGGNGTIAIIIRQ
jgi:hypothetical protein